MERRLAKLVDLIVDLREEESLAELRSLIEAGGNPKDLLGCFMEGMRRIGDEFEQGRYFIAALIMAGEIMRAATEILSPYLSPTEMGPGAGGKIILGTIQGDIHDLGKNLFAILLRCHGFEVIDLGVDVTPESFVQKAEELKPDIIGISCVLTTSLQSLKDALQKLERKLPRPQPPVVVGGTCLDERTADFVGAGNWAADAGEGLKLCLRVLGLPEDGAGDREN